MLMKKRWNYSGVAIRFKIEVRDLMNLSFILNLDEFDPSDFR